VRRFVEEGLADFREFGLFGEFAGDVADAAAEGGGEADEDDGAGGGGVVDVFLDRKSVV
jgi:hypothetical protein